MSIKVEFRPDRKRYQVTYYLNGVRKRPQFLEKAAAESFARNLRLGLTEENSDSITIDEAGKKYFYSESVRKSKKSQCNDRRYINLHFHFMTYVQGINRLATVRLEDLEAFRDWLPLLRCEPWESGRPMRMGPSTVNRCLRVMKHFYKRHIQWKEIAENPCTYLEFLDAAEGERLAMSSAQYLRTLDAAENWFKPILQFMYLTGSPASCVERIRIEDVNFSTRVYSIIRKKGRRARTKRIFFEMTESVFALLLIIRNSSPAIEGPLFRDAEGRPLKADRITRLGNEFIRAAGIEGVTLYGLRHALASDLTAANVATEIVRQAMGHSNIQTTQRYANKIGLRSIAGAIDSVRGGSSVAVDDLSGRHEIGGKVI